MYYVQYREYYYYSSYNSINEKNLTLYKVPVSIQGDSEKVANI